MVDTTVAYGDPSLVMANPLIMATSFLMMVAAHGPTMTAHLAVDVICQLGGELILNATSKFTSLIMANLQVTKLVMA